MVSKATVLPESVRTHEERRSQLPRDLEEMEAWRRDATEYLYWIGDT
jgi:hypothetical protein